MVPVIERAVTVGIVGSMHHTAALITEFAKNDVRPNLMAAMNPPRIRPESARGELDQKSV